MTPAQEKRAEARAKWFAETLAAAPPLTQEQVANLRRLLRPVRRSA